MTKFFQKYRTFWQLITINKPFMWLTQLGTHLFKCKIVNFVNLSTLSEKLQKSFRCIFCDSTSISFILLHQILLTWWNAYLCVIRRFLKNHNEDCQYFHKGWHYWQTTVTFCDIIGRPLWPPVTLLAVLTVCFSN